MAQLTNKADAFGTYGTLGVEVSTQLSVELEPLSIVKIANKTVWFNDELEYTIVVRNIDEGNPNDPQDPGLPVTAMRVVDVIDPAIARLVEGTVYINGTLAAEGTDYTYLADGTLEFIALTDLNPGAFHTIIFRVEKV